MPDERLNDTWDDMMTPTVVTNMTLSTHFGLGRGAGGGGGGEG